MEKLRSLVLDGFGINCAVETQAAYRALGVNAEIVHLSELFNERVNLLEYDILNFPGGFSYGDELGAGRVLASLLKYQKLASGKTLFMDILKYIEAGNFVVGICNGFQILLSLGLLPGLNNSYEQEAALVMNESAKFEDRWVFCNVPDGGVSKDLFGSKVYEFPVRHMEGRIVVKNNDIATKIIDGGLIAFQYCSQDGSIVSEYPYNPNNSWLSCASLIHPNKRVIGLMPHPEAAMSIYTHPNWDTLVHTSKDFSEKGDGYYFFSGIIQQVLANKMGGK